jgi:hypothetical protein
MWKQKYGCQNSNYRHGDSRSRLYNIHRKMVSRCTNPNSDLYQNYGGRGIAVCNEWLEYGAFKDWATKNGYSDSLTIDRIDNNGNYEPGNCRWATVKTQSNNRRNTRMITLNGETLPFAVWCGRLGLKYKTVSRRLEKGKSIEEAFCGGN